MLNYQRVNFLLFDPLSIHLWVQPMSVSPLPPREVCLTLLLLQIERARQRARPHKENDGPGTETEMMKQLQKSNES